MAKYQRCRIICRYPLISSPIMGPMLNIIQIRFQVFDGQSAFIDYLILTSTFTNFGMPVDNLGSDTNTVVSSWYSCTSDVVWANVVSGWDLFVAAMTSDQDLRTNLITRVHNQASNNLTTSYGTMIGGARWAPREMHLPSAGYYLPRRRLAPH